MLEGASAASRYLVVTDTRRQTDTDQKTGRQTTRQREDRQTDRWTDRQEAERAILTVIEVFIWIEGDLDA